MGDVKANGITIHYEERGAGEPLILIMGLGADGSLWEDHVEAYAQHYRCIMMDNRGAGASDKPPGPYTTELMANDTAGLMDALGIQRAHVAGISMGGAIAQQLALDHPQKVRSLVLISTWPICDTYTAAVFESFKKTRAAISLPDFAQLLQLWIYSAPYYETHIDDLIQGQADALDNPMPQHAFDAQCDACITHDTLQRLAEIQAPALITVGSADIFTPLHYSQTIHDKMADSELLVLPDLGHVHHWEDLEKFNAQTLAFLQNH